MIITKTHGEDEEPVLVLFSGIPQVGAAFLSCTQQGGMHRKPLDDSDDSISGFDLNYMPTRRFVINADSTMSPAGDSSR